MLIRADGNGRAINDHDIVKDGDDYHEDEGDGDDDDDDGDDDDDDDGEGGTPCTSPRATRPCHVCFFQGRLCTHCTNVDNRERHNREHNDLDGVLPQIGRYNGFHHRVPLGGMVPASSGRHPTTCDAKSIIEVRGIRHVPEAPPQIEEVAEEDATPNGLPTRACSQEEMLKEPRNLRVCACA